VISELRSLSQEEPDGKEPSVLGLTSSRHQRNKVASVIAIQLFIGPLTMYSITFLIIRFFIIHFMLKDTHQLEMPKIPFQSQMTAQSDSVQKPSSLLETNRNGLAMVLKDKAGSLDFQLPKMEKLKLNVVFILKEKVKILKEISGMRTKILPNSSHKKNH